MKYLNLQGILFLILILGGYQQIVLQILGRGQWIDAMLLFL